MSLDPTYRATIEDIIKIMITVRRRRQVAPNTVCVPITPKGEKSPLLH